MCESHAAIVVSICLFTCGVRAAELREGCFGTRSSDLREDEDWLHLDRNGDRARSDLSLWRRRTASRRSPTRGLIYASAHDAHCLRFGWRCRPFLSRMADSKRDAYADGHKARVPHVRPVQSEYVTARFRIGSLLQSRRNRTARLRLPT